MRKAILLLPLLAGVAATPAYAQVSARVEAKVGYDEPRAKVQIARTIRSDEIGIGDVGYGLEAGVDANILGGLLVGAYGGIDFSNAKGCGNTLFFTDDELCLDAGSNLYAGLRAGLRAGDLGLIYVKGGLSRGKFRASYFDGDDEIFDDSDTLGGWHAGGGFEADVTSNVYFKGEYIYTNYKNAFTDILDAPPEQRFETTRHQLMAGVGIRFGGVAAPPPVDVVAPPPPPVAPATQTCPNGSVILATDVCPLPPAPPPPPPPPGERG